MIAEAQALLDAGRMRPFPPYPAYLVSDDGRVLKYRRDGWLRPFLGKNGYMAVAVWTGTKPKTYCIHRMMALAFHGEPPTSLHHAAHDDGDRMRNVLSNIIWKTKLENEADKIRHGRTNRGERNGMAKLSDAECEALRSRLEHRRHGDIKRVALELNMHPGAISNILNGRRRPAHV